HHRRAEDGGVRIERGAEFPVDDAQGVDGHDARTADRVAAIAEDEVLAAGVESGRDRQLDLHGLVRGAVEVEADAGRVLDVLLDVRHVGDGGGGGGDDVDDGGLIERAGRNGDGDAVGAGELHLDVRRRDEAAVIGGDEGRERD